MSQPICKQQILLALKELGAVNSGVSIGTLEVVNHIFGDPVDVNYGLTLYGRVNDALSELYRERFVDTILEGTFWRYQKWYLM